MSIELLKSEKNEEKLDTNNLFIIGFYKPEKLYFIYESRNYDELNFSDFEERLKRVKKLNSVKDSKFYFYLSNVKHVGFYINIVQNEKSLSDIFKRTDLCTMELNEVVNYVLENQNIELVDLDENSKKDRENFIVDIIKNLNKYKIGFESKGINFVEIKKRD